MDFKINKKKMKRFEKLVEDLSSSLGKNSINLLDWALKELSVRQSLLVTEYNDRTGYRLCPRCYSTPPIDYMAYCGSCGQSLKWGSMRKMKPVSWEEVQKRLKGESPIVVEVEDDSVTIDEIIDYLDKEESVTMNQTIVHCFSTILTLLAKQMKEG